MSYLSPVRNRYILISRNTSLQSHTPQTHTNQQVRTQWYAVYKSCKCVQAWLNTCGGLSWSMCLLSTTLYTPTPTSKEVSATSWVYKIIITTIPFRVMSSLLEGQSCWHQCWYWGQNNHLGSLSLLACVHVTAVACACEVVNGHYLLSSWTLLFRPELWNSSYAIKDFIV